MARPASTILRVCALVILASGLVASTRDAVAAERERLDEPFEITADRIDYDGTRDLYVATGRVRVVQTGRSLRARWLAFSTATRIGVAEGDVVLVDGGDRLEAAFMVFDVDTLQGMLFRGSVDAGSEGFRIRAAELIRTGENTFTTHDGVFSTCRCEPGERLPWQISTKRADVELGGYGTIRNSTFDVLGVPVLWIPWAFFPVKSDRETGFLLPDFQLGGRGGVGAGLPFFWAAHPQLNVTVTPRFYGRRGYKQDVGLEYVFGPRSEGELFVSGLNDDFEEPSGGTGSERWGALWHHDHFLPAELRWHSDLKAVSDNFYAKDFEELREYRSFRFIESTTNVARDFGASGGFGAMLGARYADDQQGTRIELPDDPTTPFFDPDDDFEDGDEFVLQRWVEARADVQPGAAVGPLGVELRVDSELIHFGSLRDPDSIYDDQGVSRTVADGAFYDLGFDGFANYRPGSGEDDGRFQPGEPLADRGTRVVIHPRVARVFRLGRFAELMPEVGWSQTLYRTERLAFAERGLLTGRLELRGRLVRDYARTRGGVLRHVVEPRLGWALVSQRAQRANPLFVPRPGVEQIRLRALTLENVTRNPSDRIESANKVVLGVGQRFYSGPRVGSARLQAELLTAVDWDFAEGGLGNLIGEGRLFHLGPFDAIVRGAVDLEQGEVAEGEVGLNATKRFTNAFVREVRVGSGYRYRRRVPNFLETNRGVAQSQRTADEVNQLNLRTRIELAARWRFSHSMIYSLVPGQDRGVITNEGTVEYVSKCRCWGIGLSIFEERRAGLGAGIQIRFLGLGDETGGLFDRGLGTRFNYF